MNAQELLNNLKDEQLRGVSLNNGASDVAFSSSMLSTLVGYANDILTDLHTRFMLKEQSVLLITHPGKTNYPLRVEYSRVNGTYDGPRHIDDFNGTPFSPDFIKISGIFDQYGYPLKLNDSNDPSSAYTPEFDVIQIPGVFEADLFSVSYQVSHPLLEVGKLDQVIEIPRFLIPPLKMGIAGKFYSHLNGEEHSAKGMNYTLQYEAACEKILEKDMTNTSEVVTNVKLEQRGFV